MAEQPPPKQKPAGRTYRIGERQVSPEEYRAYRRELEAIEEEWRQLRRLSVDYMRPYRRES